LADWAGMRVVVLGLARQGKAMARYLAEHGAEVTVSDLKTGRIPNWITVPGAVLGLALQSYHDGFQGALSSLVGAALGVGIFMVLYLAGGMGAGDVKLFGAVGALVYSVHCPEQAAPFIGFWYLLGMLIPTAVGALLGPRLLRW